MPPRRGRRRRSRPTRTTRPDQLRVGVCHPFAWLHSSSACTAMPRAAPASVPVCSSPSSLRGGRDRCRAALRRPRRGRRSRCRRGDGAWTRAAFARPAAPVPHRCLARRPLPCAPRSALDACSAEARLSRTAISEGSNVASSPGLGSGAATAIRRVLLAVDLEGRDDPLDHGFARGSRRDGGVGLTTPLRSSRSRARVAPTWKRRSSSSASRFWASSLSSRWA